MAADEIRKRRDAKVKSHLEQYAPVWMENEQVLENEDAVIFDVVFRHPTYGWVSRRYRYDSFDDVLYYRGQQSLKEDDVLAIQETPPYINRLQANIPNSYGG